jgi:hypothetical protein
MARLTGMAPQKFRPDELIQEKTAYHSTLQGLERNQGVNN